MCRHHAGPCHSAHPYPHGEHCAADVMETDGPAMNMNQQHVPCHQYPVVAIQWCVAMYAAKWHCIGLSRWLSSTAHVRSWHGIGDTDGPSGKVLHCGSTILCRQMEYGIQSECRAGAAWNVDSPCRHWAVTRAMPP